MKKIVILAGLIAFTAGAFAQASEQSVKELLDVMRCEEQYNKTISMTLDAQGKAMGLNAKPAVLQAMKDFYSDNLNWKSFEADVIKLYAESFTEAEIKELTAFYKSKIGQKFLEKQPELQQKSMQIAMARFQPLIPKLQQKIKEVLMEEQAQQKQKLDQSRQKIDQIKKDLDKIKKDQPEQK